MKIVQGLLIALLIFALLSALWPLILFLLVVLAVTSAITYWKLKKAAKNIDVQWSASNPAWINQDEDGMEARVHDPEVFEAEYTERRTEDDRNTTGTRI